MYRPSRLPENPVRASPARPVGTTGSSSADPTAISPTPSSRAKSRGFIVARKGYAPVAIWCRPAAVCSSADSLLTPEFRMNAPAVMRAGNVLMKDASRTQAPPL